MVTDSPDPVTQGATLTYSLLVNNPGSSIATEVVVTNQLPAGVAFVSAQSSQGGCTRSGDTVTCALGPLTTGGVATATIQVQPLALGVLTNIATIFHKEPDINPSNNTVETVTTVAPSSALLPLRFQLINKTGATDLQLVLGTSDGTLLTTDRFARIQIYRAPLTAGGWSQITNPLVLSNGLINVPGLTSTNDPQGYFRAQESP